MRSIIWVVLGVIILAAISAQAATIDITFEASENPRAIAGAEVTNIYTALGIRFPSRPTIKDDAGEQILQQASVSGGPDPIPTTVRCAPLVMEFSTAMSVRSASMRIINRHLRSYYVRAFAEAVEVDAYEFHPSPSIEPPYGILPFREITLRAADGEGDLTRVVVNPPSYCFDLAAIDDLRLETLNDPVPIEPVPDPERPFGTSYTAREHQPRITAAGRINDVAIDPLNANHVLATSETGGLWQSTDGGTNWHHVDSLPVFELNGVHFVASNPRVIIVTALHDFQNISLDGGSFRTRGGGIWVSRDGGGSWTQPTAAIPSYGRIRLPGDRSCPYRTDAYGIAEDRETGRIFVATNCGVSFTDDIGTDEDSTWSHKFFSVERNPKRRRFSAIAALDGPGVIVGRGDGAWWSDTNGDRWTRSDTDIGAVLDFHGASGVPGVANAGFMVSHGPSNDRRLWFTRTGGRTWRQIPDDPSNDKRCGGIAQVYGFMVLHDADPKVGVYYGNACYTYRHVFKQDPAEEDDSTIAESWGAPLAGSHEDTRAIGFLPASLILSGANLRTGPRPRFLASDGGLDRLIGENWAAIGSGQNRINALQLYDLEGQWRRGSGTYRLAFGTQDNSLWSSSDELNWPVSQATGIEGLGIQMSQRTSIEAIEFWTYTTPGRVWMSGPLFQSERDWPGYATRGEGWGFSSPRRIHPRTRLGWYVHKVYPNDDALRAAGEKLGIELTPDYGRSYQRLTTPPDEVRGEPQISGNVIYQAVTRGKFRERTFEGYQLFKDVELLRITDFLSDRLRSISYPAMNGFGSMGHYGLQFAWNPVYAVNPRNPFHIIAPDVENREIKVTIDGGENWSDITGLADQITQDGSYDMALTSPFGDYSWSLVSAISFFPENPDFVVLGMRMGGAYISQDAGVLWHYIEGSNQISNILDFDWKSPNEIYVASYGRGLWKIEPTGPMGLVLPVDWLLDFLLDRRLETPILRYMDFGEISFVPQPSGSTSEQSPADAGQMPAAMPLTKALKSNISDTVVIVVNGTITGITKGQTLREQLKTTPGATVYTFTSEPQSVAGRNFAPDASIGFTPVLSEATADRRTPDPKLVPSPSSVSTSLTAREALGSREGSALDEAALASVKHTHPTPGNGGQQSSSTTSTVGIAFKGGKVVGGIIGSGVTYLPPSDESVVFKPSPRSIPPHFEGGYVILQPTGPVFFGGPVFFAKEPLYVEGRDFKACCTVVIEVNGKVVQRGIQPEKNGGFVARVTLKDLEPGEHQLLVRQDLGNGAEDTDTQLFIVAHEDEEDRGQQLGEEGL